MHITSVTMAVDRWAGAAAHISMDREGAGKGCWMDCTDRTSLFGELLLRGRLRADAYERGPRRSGCAVFLVAACLLGVSTPASAIPVEFNIQAGGTASADASRFGGPTIGSFTLAPVSGTVTLDSVTHELLDLDVTLGSSNLEVLTSAYGGYNEVQVLSVNLSKGTTMATQSPITEAAGIFTFSVGEIAVSSFFSANDTLGLNPSPPPVFNPAIVNQHLPFDAPTMVVNVAPNGAAEITFVGIPVVVLNPLLISLPVFEPAALLVIGNLTFTGLAGGGGAPIPEPSGLLLMALGTMVVGALAWKAQTRN